MILVTGAAGRLGRRVVDLLLARGYDVLGVDRVHCEDSPSPFRQVDLCDATVVPDVFVDVEAVVHMGAIPGPAAPEHGPLAGVHEESRTLFDNNAASAFNLFMAAEAAGVRRIVFSSSAFAVGWARDPAAFIPRYLPLDEKHPLMPFSPYGLTKQIGEEIGSMVARRSDTSVVSLRFTNVVEPDAQRAFPLAAPTPEQPTTLVMWAYADPRDVAAAHVLALEAELEGHEAFLLAQPTTRFREPTAELIRANFGDTVPIREPLEGNASVISTAKAQRMLGYRPRPGWPEEQT
jgi:nucleoside-diphosphate-sugar epimerase